MKIIHIILSKNFTGSERYVCDLANFQSNDHEVFIIKRKQKNTNDFAKYLNKKISISEVGLFFRRIKINNLINQISPDVVHTHLGQAGMLVNKKKFKLVATNHMNFKKKFYKKHDGLIVSNNSQFKKAENDFSGVIKKIYLWPCAKMKQQNLKNINNLRNALNIDENSYIFGSVGRFHKQKGFDTILNAFKIFNNKNCTLILIGNGYENYLNFRSKNVIILDHQDNISDYLSIFDCFISASRWETFGIALVEAMSFELPIISTIHEGNEEWINNHPIKTFKIEAVLELASSMGEFFNKNKKKQKYNLINFDFAKNCEEITKFYLTL